MRKRGTVKGHAAARRPASRRSASARRGRRRPSPRRRRNRPVVAEIAPKIPVPSDVRCDAFDHHFQSNACNTYTSSETASSDVRNGTLPEQCNTYTSSKSVPNDVRNGAFDHPFRSNATPTRARKPPQVTSETAHSRTLPEQCNTYTSSKGVPCDVRNDAFEDPFRSNAIPTRARKPSQATSKKTPADRRLASVASFFSRVKHSNFLGGCSITFRAHFV